MIKAQKKIKAFTLNEMLVVLLITAIVVGMAFSILSLVQRQMNGIEGNYERNTELNLLQQSLWIDFNTYDGVWYNAKTNELLFANGLREVKYTIKQNMITKELDTFRIQPERLEFYFNGDLKMTGEVDALHFETSKEHGARQIFVYKENATTSYLNQ